MKRQKKLRLKPTPIEKMWQLLIDCLNLQCLHVKLLMNVGSHFNATFPVFGCIFRLANAWSLHHNRVTNGSCQISPPAVQPTLT